MSLVLVRHGEARPIFRGDGDRDRFVDRDRPGQGPGYSKRWSLSERRPGSEIAGTGRGKDDNAILYCCVRLTISLAQTYDGNGARESSTFSGPLSDLIPAPSSRKLFNPGSNRKSKKKQKMNSNPNLSSVLDLRFYFSGRGILGMRAAGGAQKVNR